MTVLAVNEYRVPRNSGVKHKNIFFFLILIDVVLGVAFVISKLPNCYAISLYYATLHINDLDFNSVQHSAIVHYISGGEE